MVLSNTKAFIARFTLCFPSSHSIQELSDKVIPVLDRRHLFFEPCLGERLLVDDNEDDERLGTERHECCRQQQAFARGREGYAADANAGSLSDRYR